jgi:hypothetical protein
MGGQSQVAQSARDASACGYESGAKLPVLYPLGILRNGKTILHLEHSLALALYKPSAHLISVGLGLGGIVL